MATRASRTLITAKHTPGWLNRQLRQQRFATAGSLFVLLAFVPPFLGLVFGAFDRKNAAVVRAINEGLWNSNTALLLFAGVTLVATVLIPTVIATRRDAAYGDGLSEFLESLGSISSAGVGLAATALGWVRMFDLVHVPQKISPSTAAHLGEIAMSMFVSALACGLFAANRVDLSSLQHTLVRDRAELAELRALDRGITRVERDDRGGLRRRSLILWRLIVFTTTLGTIITYLNLELLISVAMTVLAALLVLVPLSLTNLGRFYTVRSQQHAGNSIGLWLAMCFVTATLVLGVVLELELSEMSLGLAAVLPLVQLAVPIAAWFALERMLRRRIGLGPRMSLHAERQRSVIARAMASLELRIARQELLEQRLNRALQL